MRKSFKTLLLTMTLVVCMFGSTLTTFAASISDYVKSHSTIAANGDVTFGDPQLSKYITSDHTKGTTTIDGTALYIIDGQDSALQTYVDKKQKASEVDTKLDDMTSGLDISADTGTASKLLEGFLPVVSTALGFVVILITTGMTVFSAFDLCYIAFPVFRNKCEDAKQSASTNGGKGNAMAKSNGSLRFVSDDAQFAVKSTETANTGKNPFVVYFGKRLISYIVLAILLFILLTGNITIFTDIAIKAVSGILEVIQGI